MNAFAIIEDTGLSPALRQRVQTYHYVVEQAQRAGKTQLPLRAEVLWRWGKFHISNIVHRVRGLSIEPRQADAIAEAKVGLMMLNVLLDDMAEVVHDRQTFEALARIVAGGPQRAGSLAPELRQYGEFASELWQETITFLATSFPRGYREFADEFAGDYQRVLGSIRFSLDVNENPLDTFALPSAELESRYGRATTAAILAENMNSVAFHTVDRMVWYELYPDQLCEMRAGGRLELLRTVADNSQYMHAIANALATATREIETGDLSNELFKAADRVLADSSEQAVIAAAARLGRSVAPHFYLKALAQVPRDSASVRTLRELLTLSGVEKRFYAEWLERGSWREQRLSGAESWLDVEQIRKSDELLFDSHVAYEGRV